MKILTTATHAYDMRHVTAQSRLGIGVKEGKKLKTLPVLP